MALHALLTACCSRLLRGHPFPPPASAIRRPHPRSPVIRSTLGARGSPLAPPRRRGAESDLLAPAFPRPPAAPAAPALPTPNSTPLGRSLRRRAVGPPTQIPLQTRFVLIGSPPSTLKSQGLRAPRSYDIHLIIRYSHYRLLSDMSDAVLSRGTRRDKTYESHWRTSGPTGVRLKSTFLTF